MRHNVFAAIAILAGLFIASSARAGSVPPYDLGQLAENSGVIVIGQVTQLIAVNENDRITVKVIDVIKGGMALDEFRLALTPRGLVGFDVALTEGDIGIFFLASAPAEAESLAKLTYHRSVALLSQDWFVIPE